MPASFNVKHHNGQPTLEADFGDKAIGRVTPIDSCFWWLILLRTYTKITGDWELVKRQDFQESIHFILDMCLAPQFEMSPTLLVPDGACMIDRRMGVDGHPLEIQALFYGALRSARELLFTDEQKHSLRKTINHRLGSLLFHIRMYYWLDLNKLNEIHRYKGDQFGESVMNKFNIYPDTIPEWLTLCMPDEGGYFAGNLGPSRMDFRFFSMGNLMSILVALASEEQSQQIMEFISRRWSDLIAEMPMKVCFPAVEGLAWQIMTGSDPKNVPWSYHNGGSWPVLLWMLMAANVKTDRPELGDKALAIAEKHLQKDQWPEYYDGRNGRLIGRSARKYQTWTIAGFLLAKHWQENPETVTLLSFDEDQEAVACEL
jgi:hypothetical protein